MQTDKSINQTNSFLGDERTRLDHILDRKTGEKERERIKRITVTIQRLKKRLQSGCG